jgi:hypothetical protein
VRPVVFDHVDTRVRSVAEVEPFYDRLMPALGWERKTTAHVDAAGEWRDVDDAHPYNAIEYYASAEGPGPPPAFIGFIEDPEMKPSKTRIAFALSSPLELIEWEPRLREFGAKHVERSEDMDGYPALLFEDPSGTRLELCARVKRSA